MAEVDPRAARLCGCALALASAACVDMRSNVVVVNGEGTAIEVSPTELGVLAGVQTSNDERTARASLVVLLYEPDPAHPLRPTWDTTRALVDLLPPLAPLEPTLDEMEPSLEEEYPGITRGDWGAPLLLDDGFALTARFDGDDDGEEIPLEPIASTATEGSPIVYRVEWSGAEALASGPVTITLWDVREEEPWPLAEEVVALFRDAQIALPEAMSEHALDQPFDVEVEATPPPAISDDGSLLESVVRLRASTSVDDAAFDACFDDVERTLIDTHLRFDLEERVIVEELPERCGLTVDLTRTWSGWPAVFAEGVLFSSRAHARDVVVVRPVEEPMTEDAADEGAPAE